MGEGLFFFDRFSLAARVPIDQVLASFWVVVQGRPVLARPIRGSRAAGEYIAFHVVDLDPTHGGEVRAFSVWLLTIFVDRDDHSEEVFFDFLSRNVCG